MELGPRRECGDCKVVSASVRYVSGVALLRSAFVALIGDGRPCFGHVLPAPCSMPSCP